jgi:hypothetical protein
VQIEPELRRGAEIGGLELKERALAHTRASALSPGRYRPDDALLQFLAAL